MIETVLLTRKETVNIATITHQLTVRWTSSDMFFDERFEIA